MTSPFYSVNLPDIVLRNADIVKVLSISSHEFPGLRRASAPDRLRLASGSLLGAINTDLDRRRVVSLHLLPIRLKMHFIEIDSEIELLNRIRHLRGDNEQRTNSGEPRVESGELNDFILAYSDVA